MRIRRQFAVLALMGLALITNPGFLDSAQADLFDELDEETSENIDNSTQPANDGLFEELDETDIPDALTEQEEFEQWRNASVAEYENYREELLREFAEYKQIIAEERQKYLEELARNWADPKLSSKTVWVEYSEDLKARNSVDFENQKITLENSSGSRQSEQDIRNALTDLVTKNKAQAFEGDVIANNVEQRSRQEIEHLVTADVKPTPIILSYLTGLAIATAEEVREIVDYMMENSEIETVIDESGRTIQKTEVPLAIPPVIVTAPTPAPATPAEVVGQLPKKAQAFAEYVDTHAGRAELDRRLVYAIIETESAFNPMAKSAIPAYGLMQIVPESAGLDVTKQLFGKEQILSASYLYNSEQNIEAGATYLNILYYRYLRKINDPVSRLYCAIAAYNTGAGNVAKAFTGDRKINSAVPMINQMEPDEVYEKLRRDLPYDETRRYIVKVNDRLQKYAALGL